MHDALHTLAMLENILPSYLEVLLHKRYYYYSGICKLTYVMPCYALYKVDFETTVEYFLPRFILFLIHVCTRPNRNFARYIRGIFILPHHTGEYHTTYEMCLVFLNKEPSRLEHGICCTQQENLYRTILACESIFD